MMPGYPLEGEEMENNVYWVYITASDREEAKELARLLLKARLVACVNILEQATSMYWWEDQIQEESETVMIAKSTGACLPLLFEKIKAHHSYECPCILALPVQAGHTDFLAWVGEEANMNE